MIEILSFKGNETNGKFVITESHTKLMPCELDVECYEIEQEMWRNLKEGYYVQLVDTNLHTYCK